MTLIRVNLPGGDCIDGEEIALFTDADGRLFVNNGYHSYPIDPHAVTVTVVH